MKLRGWAVPAVAALLLLTGCDQLPPGTASVVNGTSITDDEVADVADAQCVAADQAAQAGGATATAMSRVHQQSLFLLIDAELSKQYAEEEGLKPSRVWQTPSSASSSPPSPSCRRSPAPCSRTCSRTGPTAAPSSSRPAPRRPASRRARTTSSSCSTPVSRSGRRGRSRPTSRPTRATHRARTASPAVVTARSRSPGPTSRRTPARRRPTRSGSQASGQPEVRLRSWRGHRSQPSPPRLTGPREPSCPR